MSEVSTSTTPSTASLPIPDSAIPLLLNKLDAYLPYCLPLYRRLEHHLLHPNPPHAQAFVCLTIGVSDVNQWLHQLSRPPFLPGANGGEFDDGKDEDNTPWLAAHVDLSAAGQTQVSVFGTWERPSSRHPPTFNHVHPAPPAAVSSTSIQTRRDLLHAVFTYLTNDRVPLLPSSPSAGWLELKVAGKYTTGEYSRSKVLLGSVHESFWPVIPTGAVARIDASYLKYIFKVYPAELEGEIPAPRIFLPAPYNDVDRYYLAPISPAELPLVLLRTHIPRTRAALAALPSIALYERGSPPSTPGPGIEPSADLKGPPNASPSPPSDPDSIIAWGFLGIDGSLTSLHVEPQQRGRGLAVAIGRALLHMQPDFFYHLQHQHQVAVGSEAAGGVDAASMFTTEPYWSHADVTATNTGSRRVMEKLGGRPWWGVAWVEIDLNRVPASALEGNAENDEELGGGKR